MAGPFRRSFFGVKESRSLYPFGGRKGPATGHGTYNTRRGANGSVSNRRESMVHPTLAQAPVRARPGRSEAVGTE